MVGRGSLQVYISSLEQQELGCRGGEGESPSVHLIIRTAGVRLPWWGGGVSIIRTAGVRLLWWGGENKQEKKFLANRESKQQWRLGEVPYKPMLTIDPNS